MKTCNASKVCSKTQIIYTKTNNHDAPVRKRTNIYKSIRKSISQKTISAKLYFYLKTYSISCIYIYIKRPAVRKHEARHRLFKTTNIGNKNVETSKTLDEKV